MNDLLISPKLRLPFVLSTLTALAVAIPLGWILATGLVRNEAAKQLLNTLPVVTTLLEDRLDDNAELLQTIVVRPTTTDQVRITLIDESGRVLADSSRSWEQVLAMDDHSRYPEVTDALEQGSGTSFRRSASTGLEYVYAAKSVVGPSGSLYVVRLAQPSSSLQSLQRGLSVIVALASLVALGAMSAWFWWMQRTVSRATPEVLRAASRLEQGDFSQRIDYSPQGELNPFEEFLNRVAESADNQIKDLESERGLLLSVVSNMRDGLLVTDAEGDTKMANPEFRRIFGVAGEWIDRSPLELTRLPGLESLITSTLSTNEEQSAELEISEPTQRSVAVATSILGKGSGCVVVARDITDLVQLTQMRREFVANVSHELKTPLTAIRGYAETLRDGAVEDRATTKKFLGRILQQCGRLQALLEDLLTLSRLESLEGTDEVTSVEVATLVKESLGAVAHQVDEKNIRLTVVSEARPTVRGDREALERLVVNLLDNAVKYNRPGGSVTARISENRQGAVFEVEDTGLGIPATSKTRVFERFYRVDKGRSREEGGTGLGLAIVKHVAQQHGGRVEVRSQLGKGSRFTVYLPSEESRRADL